MGYPLEGICHPKVGRHGPRGKESVKDGGSERLSTCMSEFNTWWVSLPYADGRPFVTPGGPKDPDDSHPSSATHSWE